MIKWLKLLFHCHEWEIIKQGNCYNKGETIGHWYDCRCTVCGKIKGFET